MTTLEDVFLRLEGEATAVQEGTIMAVNLQSTAKEISSSAVTSKGGS